MIKKKYLKEVEFKNGVDEFKSYRNYTKKITIVTTETSLKSYTIELDNKEIDEDSLTVEIEGRYEVPVYWRKINGMASNYIEIYTEADSAFGAGEAINLNYTALNEQSSDLYSVDYENGLLYLASETNISLKCGCEFYNMFLTADHARQLFTDEYSTNASIISINNKIDSYKYISVHSLSDTTEKDYITPVLRSVKVNYLNTSEEESF